MKKLLFPLLLTALLLNVACEDYETYSDRKDKERAAITRFITSQGIQVISEDQFHQQGETTDLGTNQFVRLTHTGVYMQIVRRGYGNKVEEGKSVNILCRFMERNILEDTLLVRNDQTYYVYNSTYGTIDASQYVDKMTVTRTGSTITGSFVTGMMYQYHGSSSVPGGWLVPLNYIGVDIPPVNSDAEIAKVRLIVPHSQGTADATSTVYPCYYEITYVRER